ncbi:MAG: hypothetical protein ABI467_13575 [Kofleriaceae bacterium]
MSGRQPRSFRYGARLTITVPLAIVLLVVAGEMVWIATATSRYWQMVCVTVSALATLLAISMIRETVVRIRGRRRISVTHRELVVPAEGRKQRDLAIPFRDLRALEMTGGPGFRRVLRIRHAGGELAISGVMLGSVGELDEIHALLKAARKTRS